MNVDNGAIFTQCVYDVDNHYVDLTLRPVLGKGAAILKHFLTNAYILRLTESSNDEKMDREIELFLTKADLGEVIDRLTKVLENE